MNISMVTTYKQRCGIASYSANLMNALAKQDVNSYVVRLPRFGYKEQSIFQNILDRIPIDKVSLTHIQMEYGLFGLMGKMFYNGLAKLEKPVVSTCHAVGTWDTDNIISDVSDKVIVHNEFCRERFAGDKSKVTVIPHGMTPLQTPLPPKDICKKRLGIQPEVPVVGYLGYISEYKGIDTLIDAMVNVPNAGLLIGGGWFYEQETEYIVSLKQRSLDKLPSRCQWIGFVPDEELALAYASMDAVVYPSKFATESGALLTAVSHGKAVIASDLAPFREKEKKGALMTFKDVKDLSGKIKLLLSDKVLRMQYEENATEFAKDNSWDKIASQHISLYRELL